MAIAFLPDGPELTAGMAPVPPHSPYKAGQWVTRHGYPGAPAGPRQWGWRGVVLGSYGATILRGLTDDGREWAESWGSLLPDGTPCPDGRCACHPLSAKWTKQVKRPARVEQLALWEVTR